MTDNTWTFTKEEIFGEVEETDSDGNSVMTIPKEIMDSQDWKEGDSLKISIGDKGTIIIEKLDK
mgnify:CR=1 FL=1|jgi:AbrB family looped-hinge helix DNA binding protein|tara:strand:+ start:71 stop:262 length:192 start_codon:yes stop_codon:yes gene_type:complete